MHPNLKINLECIATIYYFGVMKESVKISKAIVDKVRKRTKKTKQTIGGFFELSAASVMTCATHHEQIAKWKDKAEKWDALGEKICKFYPEDAKDESFVDSEGLIGIGEVAATAYGYL